MSLMREIIEHWFDLKEKEMHNGSTIRELESLVDKVVFPAAVAGTAGIGAGEVENPPQLCACEQLATKKYQGQAVCAECWDALRYFQPMADEGRGY